MGGVCGVRELAAFGLGATGGLGDSKGRKHRQEGERKYSYLYFHSRVSCLPFSREHWSWLPSPREPNLSPPSLKSPVCSRPRSSPTLTGPHGAVAHRAPLSTGFPRQEHWSGLSFPFPVKIHSVNTYSSLLISVSLLVLMGNKELWFNITDLDCRK